MSDTERACQGMCAERGECETPVVKARIVETPLSASPAWKGLDFDYCQEAIRLDRENGFEVEVVE